MRLFSHSRCASDELCERSTWLGKEWGGTGLQSVGAQFDADYGNIVHRQIELMMLGQPWDRGTALQEVSDLARACNIGTRATLDWQSMVIGHLRGFEICVLPSILAEYDILEAERMLYWDIKPGFRFRFRQDALGQNKFDPHKAYFDWKTTGSNDVMWVAKYARDTQVHSSLLAYRESQGVDVQRAYIVGLYKGYHDDKSGFQRSPFTFAYRNARTGAYSASYQRGGDWQLFSVIEEFQSPAEIEGWVDSMPNEVLTAQFPRTGPIFLDEPFARKWFRQQLLRQEEIQEAVSSPLLYTNPEEVLDKHFRQDFSRCDPPRGFRCEFRDLCWQPWVEADPLASRMFVKRKEVE